jgi:hypothetical protein
VFLRPMRAGLCRIVGATSEKNPSRMLGELSRMNGVWCSLRKRIGPGLKEGESMPELDVRRKPGGSDVYHLERKHGNTHIGDYERSVESEMPRKVREIERSVDFLLGTSYCGRY